MSLKGMDGAPNSLAVTMPITKLAKGQTDLVEFREQLVD